MLQRIEKEKRALEERQKFEASASSLSRTTSYMSVKAAVQASPAPDALIPFEKAWVIEISGVCSHIACM